MSGDRESGFELDPRLAGDAVFIADWPLSRVLLMDDARFPWLVLVPRRAGKSELDDLSLADQADLLVEIKRAMALLRWRTPCEKLNVAALGNIVRQLHVHVVARHTGDAAWPGPVWGHPAAQRYGSGERERMIELLGAPVNARTRSSDSAPSTDGG